MTIDRRRFIAGGLIASLAGASGHLQAIETVSSPATGSVKPVRPEPQRGPRQELDTVLAFVRAGHGNLAKVEEMLAQDSRLVNATWDWGAGDWETALGGASHVGSRDCARYLLDHGARIDAFCAAMLGERPVVEALIAANPAVVTTKGPHGYTLLYHIAISGDVVMAEMVKSRLPHGAKDYNQALSAAVRDGHLPMTIWLFENGQVDPNLPDALGRRPLTIAREKGFTEVAEELRRHGGRESD